LLVCGSPGLAQVAADPSPVSSLKQLSLDELVDIEVTSVSRHAEKLSDAASAIQVITGDDIRRSGATSVPEALRLAGNLEVAQKDSSAWGISARGFNTDLANKLLVLMDGRAVYTPLYSGVFWPRQDYLLADLDRIEVISGPGGTLWGANAVNGVINITSKSAKDTQGLLWEAGGGSELRGFTAVRYGDTLAPGVYYRVYGKYSDRADSVLPNGAGSGDAWTTGQGGFRIDAATSAQATFTLQGDVYSNHEDVATGGTSQESGHNLLGRWSQTLPGGSDLSLQLYYDHTHLVLPTAPFVINGLTLAPAGTFRDDLDTYDLDFQHRFQAGPRQQFVWGLGYRYTHDVAGNSPSVAFLPPGLDQNLFSGFVQDEIALRPDLTLTLGTKLEHNDYTGTETEPGVRLQWRLAPERLLWAAVSRAVRMPSRIDRDLSEPAPGSLVVLKGGPAFDSETVLAYELGYRAQLGGRLALSAAAFYNEYHDLRSVSVTPTTILPFFFANNLEGETHGVELTADYRLTAGWRLHASYNLLEEHIRVKPGQMDLNHALNETADPRQQFSLRSALDLPHAWEFDAALRWVDSLLINNSGAPATVPAYAELDVRLGWHPTPALELALTGQNLLHDRHLEYGVPGPTRPEISRGVYGKATWRF
jgi:iron complex outermembrane receptor protein